VEVTEALTLLRGELLSVGLDVSTAQHPRERERPGFESRRWLEDLAAAGASAIVDAVEADAGLAVDVWVVKTQPLRFEVTPVAVDAGTPKAPEVLSLRAVEALRAALLLRDRTAPGPENGMLATPPPAPAPTAEGDAAGGTVHRLGLDVGAAALASLDGVTPAVLPMVRLSWALREWLLAQASLVGAGTRPTVETSGGTAQVAQYYATLGACYRLRSSERLRPFLALAAGALRTSVEGKTGAATEGRTVRQWSLLLDGSLGAELRVYHSYYVTLAAHVQLAEPYVIIHIAEAVGATSGRPNLAVSLTVGAWP
jgi:hypothetical protein